MILPARLDGLGYGETMVDTESSRWPVAGRALLDELAAARARLALIAGRPDDVDRLVDRLGTDLGLGVLRLGRALADNPQPPAPADVARACDGATVLTDLDVLMWPEIHIAPFQLLTALARRRPTIAVWPGDITKRRATYSTPGRPDHHNIPLRDVIVLRPCRTRFPDEMPFEMERILP